MTQAIGHADIKSIFGYKSRLPRLAISLLFLILCGSAWGQDNATKQHGQSMPAQSVAMTVADRQVTVRELCAAIATLPPPQANAYPVHPTLAAEWYGPLVALAEEAKRENLGGSLSAENSSAVDEENGLAAELIRKLASDIHPPESQIENYYAAHQREFERTNARHILISHATALASRSKRTAAEAKARAEQIAAQLSQGADFTALASRESEDPYTKDRGGELGDVSHHQMDPALDQVLWSLAPGQISSPFEDRFGYEIVQVEKHHTLPLNDVRATIIGDMKFQAVKRRQQEIIAGAHIALKRTYMESPLPCESTTFTLQENPLLR